MTAKQVVSAEESLPRIDRRILLRCSVLVLVVAVYFLSYYLYYNHLNKRASYDFIYGSFLYRRAGEDASKYKEAEKVFRDMLSSYNIRHWQEMALFYLGNIYYETGDMSGAESIYAQYISRFPAGSWAKEAGISMAYIAENRGLYRLAIERYEDLLKEFPEDYLLKEAYMGIGRAYERLKKYSLAQEYYGKIKANYPGSTWAKKAEERIEEIKAAIKLGKEEAAKN